MSDHTERYWFEEWWRSTGDDSEINQAIAWSAWNRGTHSMRARLNGISYPDAIQGERERCATLAENMGYAEVAKAIRMGMDYEDLVRVAGVPTIRVGPFDQQE